MNKVRGKIQDYTTSGNLTLARVWVDNNIMTAIIIGNHENVHYLKKDAPIELLFNESEVAIGKQFKGKISFCNQLPCCVTKISKGEIFVKIGLSFNNTTIHSLITTSSFNRLEIKQGDRVTAFIKTNEIFLKDPE